MNVDKNRYYAALTGDIIKSSKLDAEARSRVHSAILGSGKELEDAFPGLVIDGINVFRGDSVQFLLNDPAKALRVALFFRAALKATLDDVRGDMRFSIGIGTIDFFPETAKGGADGEAYRLSGPSLDNMGVKQTLSVVVSQNSLIADDAEALNVIGVLVGSLADRWTVKQALAVKGALLGMTQEEISNTWTSEVSRQAIAKNLDAAEWSAVEKALTLFEKIEV